MPTGSLARQRVVAILGRLEQVRVGGADALVRGLHRVIDGENAVTMKMRRSRRVFCLSVIGKRSMGS